MAINYDINTGTTGRLFSQAESPTYAMGQNLQNMMQGFNSVIKMRDTARQTGISNSIAKAYKEQGQVLEPAQEADPITGRPAKEAVIGDKVTDEKIRDIYAAYGDQEGVARLNDKIYTRKATKAQAQMETAIRQIETAIKRNDPMVNEIIKSSVNNFNADPDNKEVVGDLKYDDVSRIFTVPTQQGKQIQLPDGSVIEGGLGVTQQYGIGEDGKIRLMGVDTSQRDQLQMSMALAAQKQAMANEAAKQRATIKKPISYEGLAKHSATVRGVAEFDKNIIPLLDSPAGNKVLLALWNPAKYKLGSDQERETYSNVKTSFLNLAESIIRGESGAAVPDSEIKRMAERYLTTIGDNPAIARKKMLSLYARGTSMVSSTRNLWNTGEGDAPYQPRYADLLQDGGGDVLDNIRGDIEASKQKYGYTPAEQNAPQQAGSTEMLELSDGTIVQYNPETGMYDEVE